MAFDSRGAGWVQRDGELKNPYYGAAMSSCGELKASFPGDGADAGERAEDANADDGAKKKRGRARPKKRKTPPAKSSDASAAPKPAAPVDHSQHQHHQHQGHSGH
jgi:hypothetical protein